MVTDREENLRKLVPRHRIFGMPPMGVMLAFSMMSFGLATYWYTDFSRVVLSGLGFTALSVAPCLLLLGLSKFISARLGRRRESSPEDRDLHKLVPKKRVLGMPPAVVMIGLPVLSFFGGMLAIAYEGGDPISGFAFGLVSCGVGTFIGFLLLNISSPPAGGGRYTRPPRE